MRKRRKFDDPGREARKFEAVERLRAAVGRLFEAGDSQARGEARDALKAYRRARRPRSFAQQLRDKIAELEAKNAFDTAPPTRAGDQAGAPAGTVGGATHGGRLGADTGTQRAHGRAAAKAP